MIDKIKNNLSKIVLVGSVFAALAYIYNYFYILEYSLTEARVFTIARAALGVLGAILVAIVAKKNSLSTKALLVPFAVFFSGILADMVYSLVYNISNNFNFFSNITSLVVYGGMVVSYFAYVSNKKLRVVFLGFLGFGLALAITSTLSGSMVGLANGAIIASVLAVNYFEERKEEVENENN